MCPGFSSTWYVVTGTNLTLRVEGYQDGSVQIIIDPPEPGKSPVTVTFGDQALFSNDGTHARVGDPKLDGIVRRRQDKPLRQHNAGATFTDDDQRVPSDDEASDVGCECGQMEGSRPWRWWVVAVDATKETPAQLVDFNFASVCSKKIPSTSVLLICIPAAFTESSKLQRQRSPPIHRSSVQLPSPPSKWQAVRQLRPHLTPPTLSLPCHQYWPCFGVTPAIFAAAIGAPAPCSPQTTPLPPPIAEAEPGSLGTKSGMTTRLATLLGLFCGRVPVRAEGARGLPTLIVPRPSPHHWHLLVWLPPTSPPPPLFVLYGTVGVLRLLDGLALALSLRAKMAVSDGRLGTPVVPLSSPRVTDGAQP
ncbi:hypothetical protein EDB89DRAFT_1906193 [Lactarius sanguifluus]|nr:hypothetical protein EDB89DRAFT_1906193 [Lactarius sanguifluus]